MVRTKCQEKQEQKTTNTQRKYKETQTTVSKSLSQRDSAAHVTGGMEILSACYRALYSLGCGVSRVSRYLNLLGEREEWSEGDT